MTAVSALCVTALLGCEKNGECNADSDCSGGETCTQVAGEGKCVFIQKSTGASTSTPACAKDSDCAGTTPFCLSESTTAKCVECLGQGDCPTDHPKCITNICSTESTVVTCFDDAGCPSSEPICFKPPKTLSGTCVQCTKAADCPSDAPTCVTGQCKDLSAPPPS